MKKPSICNETNEDGLCEGALLLNTQYNAARNREKPQPINRRGGKAISNMPSLLLVKYVLDLSF